MRQDRLPVRVVPKKKKLRFQAAGLCAVAGFALIAVAIRFEHKGSLISSQAARRAGAPYSRLWFDTSGTLVGARIEPSNDGSKLTLDRWGSGKASPDKISVRTIELWGFDGSQWTTAPDLGTVVWTAGNVLHWEALPARSTGESATPVSASVPKDRSVLALGMLSDRSIAAALSDGSVERWDASDGTVLSRWHSPLSAPNQAVFNGDDLALSSAQAGRLLSYRFGATAHERTSWTELEEAVALDAPATLILPGPGSMAQLTPAGIRIEGETRLTPGTPRYAVAHNTDLVVTGDFEGVVVLPPSDDAYTLAAAAPGSMVAADHTHIAVSGPSGTLLFNLLEEVRLTRNGRYLSYLGLALLALAGLVVGARPLHSLITHFGEAVAEKAAKRISVPSRLPEPAAELVKVISTGQCVLWAGAGLSAQSGFPLRQTFILTLLQLATMESWADAPLLRKLTALSFHDPEAALNQLSASIGRLRHHMVPYYRATFVRFACLSKAHGYLANLPLAGAITTNYDRLLQQVGQSWDSNVITLRTERTVDTRVPEKLASSPFLLKLYGDPEANETMLFSRSEFHAALAESAAAEMVRQIFQSKTLLFIGCSLEGLLADLNELELPAEPRRKHFAMAAVAGPVWEKQAAELLRRYGIEVVVCSADQIHGALPEFLDQLARKVEASHGAPRADAAQTSAARRAS